jgi:hypothetical protein
MAMVRCESETLVVNVCLFFNFTSSLFNEFPFPLSTAKVLGDFFVKW